MPAIWLLGSSGFSAQLAGRLGLPFAFAHHFSSANTVPALALYRQHFQPSQWLERPHAMVAVSAICADTDELMLTTMVYDIDDRVRSLELITDKVAGNLVTPAPEPSGT